MRPSGLVRAGTLDNLDDLARRFREAAPYPHLVIDDFLDADAANRLHDEVRQTAANVDASNDITQKLKTACTDWTQFQPLTWAFISYLNSGEFVAALDKITGIDGLFGDPHLDGGGIHQTRAGGFLKMHTDFNWSKSLRADRRINILYYLNRDWKPVHKGELLLCGLDQKNPAIIAPIFNRLVIFNTNDRTLHGHPEPLQFPEDYPRTSIAMYYYSTGLPVKERWRVRATTTRYVPMNKRDITLKHGSLRSRIGYLLRRVSPF